MLLVTQGKGTYEFKSFHKKNTQPPKINSLKILRLWWKGKINKECRLQKQNIFSSRQENNIDVDVSMIQCTRP